ncbi:MAG: CopG family transcriptional regulator [Thermotogae bacterium]|uniref:TM1266 family iron-only hydrogenase system putative regulator n=1 Tax=Kosmotoga sp. TaxID=1955248 RepID=UPI000F186198|nr:TM1266 family iron-only hydrogenase system putative regulator [Kosmotoga sp.]MBO8166678.1 CopG family transcriptional regulator [Kosmotoga sp.]MCD6160203.1 iron-only hydrogenase system regulator [Kosmotoga sp.]RKX50178.1 MAG: CopG family transcriptional regulator [Thermotogota bacterium]
MDRKVGIVAITVLNRENYLIVNEILHEFASIILGRLGLPIKEKNISLISVIVDGTTDEIGALTGKLGQVQGVKVKSTLIKV